MQYIIKNTIRITFLDSHKSIFHKSVVEENTFNENTSTRTSAKRAINGVDY